MTTKCPFCEKSGHRYTVQMHTAMGGAIRPIIDEQGNAHIHDTIPTRVHWSCSNGHSWYEETVSPCPVVGCSWKPGDEDWIIEP